MNPSMSSPGMGWQQNVNLYWLMFSSVMMMGFLRLNDSDLGLLALVFLGLAPAYEWHKLAPSAR